MNKVIWNILSPFLRLIEGVGTFFNSKYLKTERPLNGFEKCYCGSNKKYEACHYPEHKKKQKRISVITITNKVSSKEIVKYKLKIDEDQILKRIKPGAINPLNKNRNFTNTEGFDPF